MLTSLLIFYGQVLIVPLNLLCFHVALNLKSKGKKDEKQNLRPVGILSTLSKIYGGSMFKQMSSIFEDIFSKQQGGSRKGFSMKKYLLTLLEKWRNSFDKGKIFGVLY